MKIKHLLTKTLLVAVGLLVGQSVWATPTTLYERGTTNEWVSADLTDWVKYPTANDYITYSISSGLYLENTSASTNAKTSYSATKTISPTANSVVTMTASLTMGKASGRAASYDYITIGGVSLRVLPQGGTSNSPIAQVYVDDVAQGEAVSATRNASYTFNVTIDQAKGTVTYSVSGGATIAEANSATTTPIANVVIGHNRGGSESYGSSLQLTKIDLSEEPQSVTMAGYTIKYKCGGDEIKTADTSRSGVVGSTVSLTEGDKASFKNGDSTKKYIYVSDDSGSNSIEGDGSTVITVTFREAATWSYTVNAMNGGVKIEEVATGSNFEGESVKVPFHKYYNIDGTLYSKNAISSEYNYSFTLSSDNQVENLAYTASAFNNVIFFSEAENIATLTSVPSGGGVGIRCSYSSGAYADADAVITTLAPGKYKLTGAGYGGNLVFSAGGIEILNMPTAGYERESTSDEFEITTNTDITFIGGADNNAALDYVFIQQTAVPVNVSAAGMATYVPSFDLDFSSASLKAYTAEVSGKGVCTLHQIDEVPAGTPVLLIGATENIPVMTGATAVSEPNNLVAGTGAAVATTDGGYTNMILNNVGGNVGFYLANGQTVAANRAYLHFNSSLAPDPSAPMMMVFDGEATGIADVRGKMEDVRSDFFDLQGRKVAQPAKGLYIVNGKKVVIK